MNILLLTSDFLPNIGGMATHVHELAKAHVRDGHIVHLVHPTYGKGSNRSEELDGFHVHRLFIDSATPKWKHLRYIRQTRAFILRLNKTVRFDVLHWHDYTPNCWTTYFLKKRFPLVWTNHTSNYLEDYDTGVGRMKIRTYLHHPDSVISPSRELYQKSHLTGIGAERLFYIPNGVDADVFHPGGSFDVIDKDYGIDPAKPIILCPRRLEPKNGVEYFVRAIPLVRKIYAQVQFLIVGGGFPDERARFENYLLHEGQRDGVIFTGNVPNKLMPKFYALSTIAALPSLMEATSISGLEAMASGLPLVGTRVGGIPEIIEDGVSGLLVEQKDAEALAAAFVALLGDQSLRARLGENARKRVEREFSWNEISRKTRDVYDVAARHWKRNRGRVS